MILKPEPLAAAIRDGVAETVAAAPEAAVPVLDLVDVTGGTGDWAAELTRKVTEQTGQLVAVHNSDLTWDPVVWMHQDLAGGRKQQSEDHANLVLTALGVTNLETIPRHDAGFELGDRPPVRIYLLFDNPPVPAG